MKLADLAVDPIAVEQGAWVDEIPELQGLRLKVRGNNNADWRKLQAKLLDAVPRKKRMGGRIEPADQDRIIDACLLNTCLLDWEGLEDDEGQPLPYSKPMAQKLLTEPEYRRFRDGVVWASNVVADRVDERVEETTGNLVPLSAGSTSGERRSKAG